MTPLALLRAAHARARVGPVNLSDSELLPALGAVLRLADAAIRYVAMHEDSNLGGKEGLATWVELRRLAREMGPAAEDGEWVPVTAETDPG